jgi:protein TonB
MGIRSASVMDGRTSQPAAAASPAWSDNAPDAATSGADSSRVGRRPAAAGVASAADAAPARLTAAALGQQISEWSAEYTKGLPAAEAEPPRTAKIEKLATRRLAAAAYERAWQDKVERVGNMNYPEDARRRNLTGGLMLSVGDNADGTIHSMRLRQSSGHEELDQAAMRIVRLAAPFAAFPFELRKDYDVLWITRTWRFLNDNHLATTP